MVSRSEDRTTIGKSAAMSWRRRGRERMRDVQVGIDTDGGIALALERRVEPPVGVEGLCVFAKYVFFSEFTEVARQKRYQHMMPMVLPWGCRNRGNSPVVRTH